MPDRVEDKFASVEDIRLAIMEDLITRYLSGEFDLRRFTDYVTISRNHYPWNREYAGSFLREMTYHHLFFYRIGAWPESTLRESLAFLLYEMIEGDGRWQSPMVDKQWFALLKAGHVPPGSAHHQHTKESLRAMTPQQLADLRRKLGFGD